MTESPSETPLTDAAESPFHIIDGVTRDFARSLERKLREAEKDAAWANARISAAEKRCGDAKAVHTRWYRDGTDAAKAMEDIEYIFYSVRCYLEGVPGQYLAARAAETRE